LTAPASRREPLQFRLSNGLRVLIVENRAIPTIAMNVAVLSGSRYDSEALAGTAMMASRLLEEGTRTRSSLEIADAIESVGGVIETDCTFDRLSVFLGVLSRDIGLGLELVSDIIQNPTFSEDSIRNESDRTLAEIRSAMDRPQVVAGWEFNELVYGAHPLHRPVHGYAQTIPGITREHLVAFHEASVTADNAILAVVGDFVAEEMRQRLELAFRDWRSSSRAGESATEAPQRTEGVKSSFVAVDSRQAHIFFGNLGIRRTHPDFYTLQVMDTILGGGAGLTARIPQKLRDELGLAYTTFAGITNSAGRDPGKFLAYIGTSPENVGASIDGFISEIEEIRCRRVSEEELVDAKAYLTGSFVFGFETNSQVARFLVNAELFALGFDYLERYPSYIEAVTGEGIQRAASSHLSTQDYVLVIAGPPEAQTRYTAGG